METKYERSPAITILKDNLNNKMSEWGEILQPSDLANAVLDTEKDNNEEYSLDEIRHAFNEAANEAVDSWIDNAMTTPADEWHNPEEAADAFEAMRPSTIRRKELETALAE